MSRKGLWGMRQDTLRTSGPAVMRPKDWPHNACGDFT